MKVHSDTIPASWEVVRKSGTNVFDIVDLRQYYKPIQNKVRVFSSQAITNDKSKYFTYRLNVGLKGIRKTTKLIFDKDIYSGGIIK